LLYQNMLLVNMKNATDTEKPVLENCSTTRYEQYRDTTQTIKRNTQNSKWQDNYMISEDKC